MSEEKNKYLLLSFDVESDIGSWTQNYTSVDEAVPLILDILSRKKVCATFFYTAKAALYNPNILKKVLNAGHEIGCHSYQHETLGEAEEYIPGDRVILPEEIQNRLKKATKVIEEISGIKPLSFRAPSFNGSNIMMNTLEKLGYLVDCSYNIAGDKNIIFPYHPDSNNWDKEGSLNILEIPIAGLMGEPLENFVIGSRKYIKNKSKTRSLSGQWPILRLFGPEEFCNYLMKFAEKQIKLKGVADIVIVLHPWEFLVMPKELKVIETKIKLEDMLHLNTGKKALEYLEYSIDYFKEQNFNFIKMKDYSMLWKNNFEK